MEQLLSYAENMIPRLIDFALTLLGGVLILIAGWTVAGWLSRRVESRTRSSRIVDETLAPIFGQLTRILIVIFTVLAVLSHVGIQTASLLAILGAAGLAIGLALQGTLSNIASGIMLLMIRPFRLGDIVEADGVTGAVDEIGLFTTKLHTDDRNSRIIIPNSKVWGSRIHNHSFFDSRRVELEIRTGSGEKLPKAVELIREALASEERIQIEPGAEILISEFQGNDILLLVRFWVQGSIQEEVRSQMVQRLLEQFESEGLPEPISE